MPPDAAPPTATLARERLRRDQAMGPIVENRARLTILSDRLARAGRAAMADHLASRVRTDRRFAPVLGQLMQLALQG